MTVYSFDVFDTIITRKVARPEGIFQIIGEQLRKGDHCGLSDFVIDNFTVLRQNAEVLARKKYCVNGVEEITLIEIYEAFALAGGLSKKQQDYLISLEQQIEYENVVPIPENINKIHQLISEGYDVLLISDMYLSEEAIKRMLGKVDEHLTQLPLFVSSEYRKAKWTGNLYRQIQNDKKLEFSSWQHMGDNEYSDVKIPNFLGMKGYHYKKSQESSMEKLLLDQCGQKLSIERSIGVSRYLRIINEESLPYYVGAAQGGPVLFAYVWWLLMESVSKKIKRLYFIARDGYILQKIADIIIKQYDLNIKTSYIYGSRRAWRMAGFGPGNDNIKEYVGLSHDKDIYSIKQLADVFKIKESELLGFLPAEFDTKIELNSDILSDILVLLDTSLFKQYLFERLKDERELLLRYIKENVDYSDEHFAFVELAGGGFTQKCFSSIMRKLYPRPTMNFFMKMDTIPDQSFCEYFLFLPSFLKSNLLIEMMCRAPHGQTQGYKIVDERVVPVLKENEKDSILAYGYLDYERGVLDYTSHYTETVFYEKLRGDSLEVVMPVYKYIAECPDKQTMDFWGSIPNGVTGREEHITEFAPVLTKKMIFNMFFNYKHRPYQFYYRGSDPNYSYKRSTLINQKFYSWCEKRHVKQRKKVRITKEARRLGLTRDFPIYMVKDKVVLYGAGKMGQYYFDSIHKKKPQAIIKWVDKQFEKFTKHEMVVESPTMLCGIEFDQIIIAVKYKQVATEIMKQLEELGIDKRKVLWLNLVG